MAEGAKPEEEETEKTEKTEKTEQMEQTDVNQNEGTEKGADKVEVEEAAGTEEGSPENSAGKKEKKAKKEKKEAKPEKDQKMAPLRHKDVGWIWIGDAEDARDGPTLRKNGIKYVLNCTPCRADGGVANFHEKDPLFSYCRLAMGDNATESLSTKFEAAWEFLERARIREDGGVLVHCQMGVSRSVSMVISYLMKYMRMGFDEALALLKDARKQANPNEGFTEQLKELDETLRRTNGYETIQPKREVPFERKRSGAARGPAGPTGPPGPAVGPAILPAGASRGPVGPPRGPVGPSRGPVGPAG
eukprot:CAMPEP_0170599900 /NCGR_PEP_ID=MMETSP0224-20130122/17049_1 /TAXON_ID=285029 /ORGANISM="Togula jolla, Strain CCCM 725" /LENGTH=302 /DNA_ID=CAMNT_0010924593 /DNA_START=76 /DNA_END=981 /DNA_ORIENTATION=-